MGNLSWLKRPFDPRPQYSFLYTFCGMLTVMLLNLDIQIFVPSIPRGWDIPLRLLLGAAFAGVVVLLAYWGRNRKHSFVRGWGWDHLGMILGCLAAARMEPEAGHMPVLAGILTLLLAALLYQEWKERELAEE